MKPDQTIITALTSCLLLTLIGCGLLDHSDDFEVNLEIVTDSTHYTLRLDHGVFRLQMRVEITNQSSHTVYLHRSCGFGDEPDRHLVRADSDTTDIYSGNGSCITRPLRLPIPVVSAATYVDNFELVGEANSRIIMAMVKGKLRLVYSVQRRNVVEGWYPVDLVPESERISNTFEVTPP